MFENTKIFIEEKVIPLLFTPVEPEIGDPIINQECLNRLRPIIEKKIDGYIKDNEFILMEANEEERDVLTNLIESSGLSSTTIRLTDRDAKNAYDGKIITVVKWGEEQGKYTQSADYGVSNIDGSPTDLKVRVVKLTRTNLSHLERMGYNSTEIHDMYEAGLFPDDLVDVLKLKMI